MVSFSVYLVFSFWLLGFYFLWKIPTLKSSSSPPTSIPNLSIIIPARNEAKNLGILLNSLQAQTIQPSEIIVVDDHSADATSDIASKAGCVVIPSQPLPDGWAGKPWACWQGAGQSSNEILLFLDADTYLRPDGIQRLLTAFHEKGGLLSVQPFHCMDRWVERLAAFFNIITLAGMNTFTLLGDRLKPMGAFGPCNICWKNDYFRAGGHETVRGGILESLGLGKAFLAASLPVSCYGGRNAVSFRMYPDGLTSLFQGFSKGFGIGARATTLIGQLFIFCWIYGAAHLTRHLIQSAVETDVFGVAIFALLNSLYIFQIHWMLRRIGNFKFMTALFYQIPLLFFIGVFCVSIFKTFVLRKTGWKGRTLKTKTG